MQYDNEYDLLRNDVISEFLFEEIEEFKGDSDPSLIIKDLVIIFLFISKLKESKRKLNLYKRAYNAYNKNVSLLSEGQLNALNSILKAFNIPIDKENNIDNSIGR